MAIVSATKKENVDGREDDESVNYNNFYVAIRDQSMISHITNKDTVEIKLPIDVLSKQGVMSR